MAYSVRALVLIIGGYLVCFAVFLVGFSSPQWVTNSYINTGIWQRCFKGGRCLQLTGSGVAAYIRGTQALMCVSLICCIFALVAFLSWFFMAIRDVDDDDKRMVLSINIAALASISTAVFTLLSVIVFAIEIEGAPNGYAYWLTVLSCAMYALIGTLTVFLTRFI